MTLPHMRVRDIISVACWSEGAGWVQMPLGFWAAKPVTLDSIMS
jgi:hypothetical protein